MQGWNGTGIITRLSGTAGVVHTQNVPPIHFGLLESRSPPSPLAARNTRLFARKSGRGHRNGEAVDEESEKPLVEVPASNTAAAAAGVPPQNHQVKT